MKELSLQEIREIELELFEKFHSFCVDNDIRYFMTNGTLLGALRYKGFIPWDDDIDVLLPREDYNKLISLFPDSDRCCLVCHEKNHAYRFPFAKLCDMSTLKIEGGYDNGVELGVDIDVFPLDAWDNDLLQAKQEVKRQQRNMFCLALTKVKKPESRHPVKRMVKGILMAFCKLRGSTYYVEQIMKEANKPEQKGSAYMGIKSWCIYGERDIVPAEAFADVIQLEFEGKMFYAPVGYDTFMTSLYGDYMPEPPAEKRKTHHSFKAYRL